MNSRGRILITKLVMKFIMNNPFIVSSVRRKILIVLGA